MKEFIVLIFLMFSIQSYAQETDYIPSKSNIPSKKTLDDRLELNVATDLSKVVAKPTKQVLIESNYVNRAKYIHLMAVDEDEYIYNSLMNEYVNEIFNHILDANQMEHNENYEVFVSRNLAPNSSNFGDGSVVINSALIRRLENEHQVAFVLAHELAHTLNQDVNGAIIKGNASRNSQTEIEVNKIIEKRFTPNLTGEELLDGIPYNNTRHSRMNEAEADKKAMELLANTKFNLQEAAETLQVLDHVDEEKYQDVVVMHKQFNRELYPFKPEWKEEKNALSSFFDSNDELKEKITFNADTLKTHPDCIKRYELVSAQAKKLNSSSGFVSKISHDEVVKQANFDYVLNAYHYNNFGYSIYQSLQLQQIYPDHPFLVGIIGACMGEMVKAMNKHQLGNVLPLSSPEYSENYNELLKILNNLTMQEMREVAWNYVAIYQDNAEKSEALAYALALTAKEKKKSELYNKYKKLFLSKFPNSYFIKKARKI